MPLIVWSSALEVGVAKIDSEHKELVAILNQLHQAMADGRGNEVLRPLLDKLVKYTVSHFAMEERMMREHRYPEAKRHTDDHRDLTTKVAALQAELAAGRRMLSLETLRFLQQWLSGHILGADKALAIFLKSREAAKATA